MTNLEKIKFIDEFDMLDELRESINMFSKKDNNDVLQNIKKEVDEKLLKYSTETYFQYKQELLEEYKNDIDNLKDFIKTNLSDTVNKMFWLKYLNDLASKKC
ncbi:hypothetical protein QB607_003177 [Clostridium botulinum]|nr:hypothetical protein [Clostridium botulinum]EKS4395850.1 hypothetical protein [Clostridium botulinum]